MEITMKFNYQQAIESIYTDARWEAYYDPVIIPFFNICCYNTGVKIVPVHATRKSGRKPLLSKKHFIDTYSMVKRKIRDGKEVEIRYGIPDYVIVPIDSTYDNPKKSLLNIEFKLPEDLTGEYKEINPIKYKTELQYQFEYCANIILTDGVTWYFLKNADEINTAKPITLYDHTNKCWKKSHKIICLDCEKALYDDQETDQCAPNELDELLETIKSMIEKAIKNNHA